MSKKNCCPKCENQAFTNYELPGGITADCCPKCEGLWFEKGEVAKKLRFSRDFPNYKEVAKTAKKSKFFCPVCREIKLERMKFIPEDPLLIEHCPSCRGIWLDATKRNSLKKIAKRKDLKKINFLKAAYLLKDRLARHIRFLCPNCKRTNFFTFKTSKNVSLDFCKDCKGVWLDASDTKVVLNRKKDIPEFDAVYKLKKKTRKPCPKCHGKIGFMVEFPFSTKFDLLIDYCEKCGGIWCDSFEFEKLKHIGRGVMPEERWLYEAKKELTKAGELPIGTV
ncbi:zf-TFIIB domain-containing protein [Candidatus Riflebacteria bacterium]